MGEWSSQTFACWTRWPCTASPADHSPFYALKGHLPSPSTPRPCLTEHGVQGRDNWTQATHLVAMTTHGRIEWGMERTWQESRPEAGRRRLVRRCWAARRRPWGRRHGANGGRWWCSRHGASPWACGPPTRCGTNSDCGASGRSPVRDAFAAGPVVTLWTHLAWPPAVGTPWQRMGSPC